ncbi:non-hydrolyzing UDP-N-acetylglucosamine 2-epimerase [Qipengyuania oceanensis]|uniref:UDP-N-acetylglucosamine 2-epimerase (non-hydrolyzing) n=1 Tax=Qipengyuania oceanensis TaxID=1463597 RepID=A0A844YJH3_9SPHN|nr:UDP-N-acetylglucosamine 2-epimerase (non-hydrolyzing) [Qipengyuania oceanensis]MXO63094.1 UDP-N-acetylglucosamine 2-epimerase (non-hydrolyzing) [Qipengyuania oceanensis]
MGSQPKILTVVGTRPEAIKLFPLIHALRADGRLAARVCATGQHAGMLADVLALAGITPDHDLGLMCAGQSLDRLTARLIEAIGEVLDRERPDVVIVQGDTTSAFAGALAAHYRQIPVAHVEAGLRSGNMHHPWPEEFNRKAIAAVADWHFAPTDAARDALLAENVRRQSVHVTGNTVIDALLWMRARLARQPSLAERMSAIEQACHGRRIIAVTCHRRENLDGGVERIAAALAELASRNDVAIVLPLHPNPSVRSSFLDALSCRDQVHLVEPLGYPDFVRLLDCAHLALTDSGGVQEEAPALGTPVLVMRETTERLEGIAAGTARLVGTDSDRIVAETARLLDDPVAHATMAQAHNPYGDGRASGRIVDVLAAALIA